jgi:hypothetical protein
MRLCNCVLIFLMLLPTGSAVQNHKHKVHIAQYGHDSVGSGLAYNLREEASKSVRYALVSETDADVRIELVSADEGEARLSNKGSSSAISFVFTVRSADCAERDWLFLKQGVYIAGKDRTASIAKSILATLDEALGN